MQQLASVALGYCDLPVLGILVVSLLLSEVTWSPGVSEESPTASVLASP